MTTTETFTEKDIKGAKAIIKRRRTLLKKAVEKKAPLFAEVVLSAHVDQDPIEHLRNRKIFRAETKAFFRRMYREDQKRIHALRAECRAICTDDAEFFAVIRRVARFRGGSRLTRWLIMKQRLQNRSVPLSPNADLVAAWLEVEDRPVSHRELHEKRGDGLSAKDILDALHELSRKELARICGSHYFKGMPCAVWQKP